MQADLTWVEWRCKKLPALNFPVDYSSAIGKNFRYPLFYPTSESTLNSTNYEKVKAKDKITTKILGDPKMVFCSRWFCKQRRTSEPFYIIQADAAIPGLDNCCLVCVKSRVTIYVIQK